MLRARELGLITIMAGCVLMRACAQVDIVTPTGNKLVEGLTFELHKGEALLITGHNGAGKSSE